MTDGFEDSKLARRYENLALETNRSFAYAKVYANMLNTDAAHFAGWVRDMGLTDQAPADNLDSYYGVDLGSAQEGDR